MIKPQPRRRKLVKLYKKSDVPVEPSPYQENLVLIEEIDLLLTKLKANFFNNRMKLTKTNKQNLEFMKNHLIRCEEILSRS